MDSVLCCAVNVMQGCRSRSIPPSRMGSRGVSFEHMENTDNTEKMENMEMFSDSPTEMLSGSPTEMFCGSPTVTRRLLMEKSRLTVVDV